MRGDIRRSKIATWAVKLSMLKTDINAGGEGIELLTVLKAALSTGAQTLEPVAVKGVGLMNQRNEVHIASGRHSLVFLYFD